MNNFDSSTSGVNLELSVCWDNDLSRMYFDENFQRLDNDTFLFIDSGNFSDDFDFTDLDNYDLKSITNKNLLANIRCSFYGDSDDLKDDSLVYFNKYPKQLNKSELIELVENAFPYDYKEFLTDNFKPNFESLTVTGVCQGDQATVIFTYEDMKEYNFENREKFIDMMQEYFENIFYNAPLYCRLTIDNNIDDFYLDDFQKDQYSYDKEEILEHAKKNIKHDKKAVIIEFLNDNLPEYPDYE